MDTEENVPSSSTISQTGTSQEALPDIFSIAAHESLTETLQPAFQHLVKVCVEVCWFNYTVLRNSFTEHYSLHWNVLQGEPHYIDYSIYCTWTQYSAATINIIIAVVKSAYMFYKTSLLCENNYFCFVEIWPDKYFVVVAGFSI